MADEFQVSELPEIFAFDINSLIGESLTNSCTFYDKESSLSNTVQVQKSEKSPFHESDSGLSEMSDLSGNNLCWEDVPMLDEMLDNMETSPFLFKSVGSDDVYRSQDADLVKYLQTGSSEQSAPEQTVVPERSTAPQTCRQTRSRSAAMTGESENHSSQIYGRSVKMSQQTDHGFECVDTSSSKRTASKRQYRDSESDESIIDVTDGEDVSRHKRRGSVKVKRAGAKLPCASNAHLSGNSNVTSVKVLRILKSGSDDNTEEDVVKALEERNRKNAEMARQNRLKKKAYLGNLERDVEDGRKRICELESALHDAEEERDSYKREVEYLKSVLANQSALAGLLKNIPNVEGVTLSSSVSRKRVDELDHSYTPTKKGRHTHHMSSSRSGVCLHVDSDSVSLEFCHHCAEKASGVNSS